MIDVTALGELVIDFAPKSVDKAGYPTLAANPGGAPGNFLAALNKYGCSVAMIGKVGDDMFGRLLLGTLKQAGIETKGIIVDPDQFTTLAFVSLDESGNRDFSFARKPGADTCLTEDEVDADILLNSRVFHFGTLSLTDDPARTATHRAVAMAKEKGLLISVDPNLRMPLWRSAEEAKAAMEWSLRQADIVKISDEEIEFLWGLTPEEGAKKLLEEYGASLVYATLGPKGCYVANKNGSATVESPKGLNVIDTTGAGDIFGGSAMSRFLKLGKPASELTVEEMTAITRFACTAASLSTQVHGAISSIPEIEAVEKKLAE